MKLAALLARRGQGKVEPNPMVGCVLVAPDDTIVGWGYHKEFGGPHAEIEALRRAGNRARDCTAYVTLEPCRHVGKTGPCTDALIGARVRRVVIARKDPSLQAGNGSSVLEAAGIEVIFDESCKEALDLSDPFVHNTLHQMPWVIAKWAQSVDGLIAPAGGNSRWISGVKSRRAVHRLRGKVDAIITGIGTVKKDDPLLTSRDSLPPSRLARRIVLDSRLEISLESRLVGSAADTPVILYCIDSEMNRQQDKVKSLAEKGVSVLPLRGQNGRLPLRDVFKDLFLRGVSTCLVEAGGGLLDALFSENLINEAWVFTAPILLGSKGSRAVLPEKISQVLSDSIRLDPREIKVLEKDILTKFRVDPFKEAPFT